MRPWPFLQCSTGVGVAQGTPVGALCNNIDLFVGRATRVHVLLHKYLLAGCMQTNETDQCLTKAICIETLGALEYTIVSVGITLWSSLWGVCFEGISIGLI